MSIKTSPALISIALLAGSGCATFRTGTWIGAGAGGSVGALSGAAIGSPDQALEGAAIGIFTGAIIGGVIGTLLDRSETAPPSKEKNSKEEKTPRLSNPEIRRIWQPDKIEGDRYIEGHYLFLKEKEASWIMD